ncbi:Transmembrane protein 41A [Modicella reniformis]|uniref:Transmembrane protein 41A n=1 Tax=Modicella reniformis TaxID=1440133 RepID=A0A9P6J6Y9_9FUNG|nr:Transmembrane protein 41A [Modicella reniformis]
MSMFVAPAANAATVAVLGRFHSSTKSGQTIRHPTGRQRSSSFTDRGRITVPSLFPSSVISPSAPLAASKKLAMSNNTLTKALHQAQQYQGEDLDRINHIPSALDSPKDQNSDLPAVQTQENAPTICTGRSRSNTLTTTSSGAVEIAEASISNQLDHVMRPALPTIVLPDMNNSYPPMPLRPQYHDVEESKDDIVSSVQTSDSSSPSSSLPWINAQLDFLSRIVILIGLFGLSLGGLYFLAQILPPLSLPKSIDDVKVDAAILQDFATATYEGWIRTFWVFSVVYIWKQCFGIPGSAFLNILAGALYGPWFGTVLTSLLTTLGSVLAYFMSFFLLEPILNRYASSRLDQMRLQIQKKAMRSSSSAKKSSIQNSTATSTAVQPSINAAMSSISSSTSISASNGISESAPTSTSPSTASVQRGALLRTRSSSFTVRRIDESEQHASTTVPMYQSQHGENEIQESKGLLCDERNVEDSIPTTENQNTHASVTVEQEEEEKEEDQDDTDGTSLFMQLLLIRLFPLTPYWFINLASPLVGVPVVPFMTSMFLGCMPYNYICAQAGAILSEIHELRDIYQQPWILVQVTLVLLLSTAAILISKRTKKKQLEKEGLRKSRSSEEEEEVASDETTQRLLSSTFEDVERHRHSREEQQDTIAMSSLDSSREEYTGQHFKRDSAVIDMSAYHH